MGENLLKQWNHINTICIHKALAIENILLKITGLILVIFYHSILQKIITF